MSGNIRPPAVAGAFYPADPTDLRDMISTFLSAAETTSSSPKALIAPHAGYAYSGPVAATGYAMVQNLRRVIRRVVLLGPAHRVAFTGLASSSATAFATPIGEIPIDHDAYELLAANQQVQVSDLAHQQEHSLEVHLPFLQTVLDDFSLVPLVVGRTTPDHVADVLKTLWGDQETLIIISSDLSHYHEYQTAQSLDKETSQWIESLQWQSLTGERACGFAGIRGMLQIAEQRGYDVRTLDLRNSGDTAGDKSRVVGYGTYGIFDVPTDRPMTTSNADDQPFSLSDQEQQTLLEIAAASIAAGLQQPSPLQVDVSTFDPALQQPGATFVTLKQQGKLRGCIGSVMATRPLVADVSANAYASGFRDPRFPPLHPIEVENLSVEISVLSPLSLMKGTTEAELLGQIRPGQDGLVIEYGQHRGLLLPSVWESIPEREPFFTTLKQKAGLSVDFWSEDVVLRRFETFAFSSTL